MKKFILAAVLTSLSGLAYAQEVQTMQVGIGDYFDEQHVGGNNEYIQVVGCRYDESVTISVYTDDGHEGFSTPQVLSPGDVFVQSYLEKDETPFFTLFAIDGCDAQIAIGYYPNHPGIDQKEDKKE